MTVDRLASALSDRYRIEHELGAGGMATVYLAHDLKHDRDVAIKVMHQELSAVIGSERFLREIATIARLQHPHILPLIDSDSSGSTLYYVTPYVRGETLRDLIAREGRLDSEHAARLAAEIADALAYAHREGVVHRDIKPENILLQEGHAVVADFGVARALASAGATSLTQTGLAIGTPAYMSPEQVTGSADVDGKSDVYAIGCVLFEMLAGQTPFAGTNAQQIIAAHMTTPAPGITSLRGDIPRQLADMVAACLAKDPASRPDASSLEMRLRANTGAVATADISRGRLITFAAVTVALLAAGAWWFIRQRGEASTTTMGEGATQIAVMPLSAISDTSLARLGQDLVVTLSTTLDGVGELRTVDAATLLLNTRNAPSPLPLAEAKEIATKLGAGGVLIGTLIGEAGQVRAAVALYRIGDDTAVAKASTLAPPGAIAALTDSLTWQLLREVWRKGTPPSPVLAGLTTGSFEALRHFLNGERHFQKLDIGAATAEYRRAFELDSNFVQAYLRYDLAVAWSLQATDAPVRDRLLALADRLPERDRLWLEASHRQTGPLPEQAARWRELIKRYPDYPPILMSGVDGIIHSGPMFGIGLAETLPILERLARLTPDNADVWFHKGLVEDNLGMAEAAAQTLASGATGASGYIREMMSLLAIANRTASEPDDAEFNTAGIALARFLATLPSGSLGLWFTGSLTTSDSRVPQRLMLVEQAQREIYQGEALASSWLGKGSLQIATGDWSAGLATLRQHEAPAGAWDRTTTARLAALGAWLGTVDPSQAAEAVRRARELPPASEIAGIRIELHWWDGLLAILADQPSRLQHNIEQLRNEHDPMATHAANSLHAHWLVHTGVAGAADSVRAISDTAMVNGRFLFTAEVVNRFVIARALRTRGNPEVVERYLMWIDAMWNTPTSVPTRMAIAPLVQFERGMALEEAGNHDGAVLQLSRFLAALQHRSPGQQEMIDEARRVVSGGLGPDSAQQRQLDQ